MSLKDLEAPLLGISPSHQHAAAVNNVFVGLSGGVLNLTKAIIGAGMLSIPRAFSLLGAGLGTLALVAVAALMIITVDLGITAPSISAGALLFPTYGAEVKHWKGPHAERFMSFILMLGLLGIEASYMDIIADVLLGNNGNTGVLTDLVTYMCKCDIPSHTATSDQVHGNGSESAALWMRLMLDRKIVLGGMVSLVIIPLSLRRNMGTLSIVNALGLASLAAFLLALFSLTTSALWAGTAHELRWLPNLAHLGSDRTTQALAGFNVLSVLLTASSCHANMHPLLGIVKPVTRAFVGRIVIISIAISTAFYWLTSVSSYLVFGDSVHEDILTNLSPAALEPFVGVRLASVMGSTVRIGYLISITGTAVLVMFPLRQTILDLFLGSQPSEVQQLPPPATQQPTVLGTSNLNKQPDDTDDEVSSADSDNAHLPRSSSEASDGSNSVKVKVTKKATKTGPMAKPHHTTITCQSHQALPATRQRQPTWSRDALHVPLTLGVLTLAYVMAVSIPSIWVVISLVGSCSGTFMCFIMPGLLGLAFIASTRQQTGSPGRYHHLTRAALYGTMLLGALMFINGFISLYLKRSG